MRRASLWLMAALACCVAAPGAAVASTPGLRWNAFGVEAYLDAEGALHVRERHAIVFTGDCKGAERVFGLRSGQSLTLERVSRVDPVSGALRPLVAGDVDQVDHYAYSPSSISVRWRSRLPSAPAFAQTEIVYVIDYVLHGVLQPTGDSLRLAHDFGFGHTGEIETVSVQLRAASSWRPTTPLGRTFERRNLPTNEPVIVEASFDTPRRFERRRMAVVALLLLVPLVFVLLLLAHERWRGRLAPLERVDMPVLEQQLVRFKPELVAVLWAAWGGPGRNAVAALLARMVLEHKIAVRGESLELRIERERLEGYERELVDGLFFAGDTSCVGALRSHCRESGFSPRESLAPLVAERDRLIGPLGLRWSMVAPVLALLASGVIASLAAPGEAALRTAVTCAASLLPALLGAGLAVRWRSRLDLNEDAVAGFVIPALMPPLGAVVYVWLDSGVMILAELGVALIALAFCAGVIALAAGNETRAGLQLRRRLTADRVVLARALRRRHQLPDAIVPYLIAFDLDDHSDASRPGPEWAQKLRSIAAGVATPWARSGDKGAW